MWHSTKASGSIPRTKKKGEPRNRGSREEDQEKERKKKNNFGLTNIHGSYWNCNSEQILFDHGIWTFYAVLNYILIFLDFSYIYAHEK